MADFVQPGEGNATEQGSNELVAGDLDRDTSGTLFDVVRWKLAAQFVTRPLLCMCVRYSADEVAHWGPCPSSLCDRRSHALAHRIATSGRDFRYGGFRAWLRWIVTGTPADWEDE